MPWAVHFAATAQCRSNLPFQAMLKLPFVPGGNVHALSAQGTLLRSALRALHRARRHQAAILTRVLGLATRYSYSYSPLRQVRTHQLRIAPQRHTVSSTAPYSRHPRHLAHAMGRAATSVRVCKRPTPPVSHAITSSSIMPAAWQSGIAEPVLMFNSCYAPVLSAGGPAPKPAASLPRWRRCMLRRL